MPQDVALVTGASSGIGAALARRIAATGRRVVLVARSVDRLDDIAREIEAQHGVETHVIPTDLGVPAARGNLVDELTRRDLTVDWLVNNAGFGTNGRFHELPVERELEEIRLNVEALVDLTGRFMPAMVARRRGAVVNVSSVAGYCPGPYTATYSATKAFVSSFSEAIAVEARGTGVDVLCVCPGFTRTEFQDRAEIDTSALPGFVWMSADEVADQAVRSVGKGPVLVNGMLNRVMAMTMRYTPHALLGRVAEGLLRPRTT
jgi:hypothetical protein